MDDSLRDGRSPDPVSADFDSLVPPVKVDRRGFLAGSAGAGFALAVAPTGPLLAQTITTPATGLRTGDVLIPTRDGRSMPGYFAAPANASGAPTVLVVQEIFGVHEHIKDICRRFARAGWHAVAPELFFRFGDPQTYPTTPQILSDLVPKVTDAQVMSDLDATLAFANTNGGDAANAGITGFCWGGRIVWLYAAHNPRLKAGVAWYGRLTGATSPATPFHPYEASQSLKAPVLGLYGGADAGIPVNTVDEMKTRLAAGPAPAKASEFVVYPDAPHAFHADYRPSFRKEAAEDGWKRATAWFRKHGPA
ncbi:MAG: dienelactone hydrolase family protein [Burkholderiales bacterium]